MGTAGTDSIAGAGLAAAGGAGGGAGGAGGAPAALGTPGAGGRGIPGGGAPGTGGRGAGGRCCVMCATLSLRKKFAKRLIQAEDWCSFESADRPTCVSGTRAELFT